jgi:hypothetical protein
LRLLAVVSADAYEALAQDEVRAAASTVCSLSQVRESSHAARLRRRVLLALLLRRGAIRGAK